MRKEDWKVLLIDDDPGIRKILRITLEDAGYEVLTAEDGETGLRMNFEECPDIVITDVRMPGMDGIEVLRKIKAYDPDKEVIVTTAFSEMELAVKALQLNASDFITKPISDSALMVALERAKDRYRNRRTLQDYTTLIEERWMETSEELAKTFNFQKMLIDASIDGIIACDKEGKVIVFNRSMEQMLGYSREEVIGNLRLEEFFFPGEAEKFRYSLSSEAYGGRNRLFLFETLLAGKNGITIPGQISATLLYQENVEVGLVAFFRDLREIRKMTQQFEDQTRLLHQDKMISLGRLAASVVHEINNPLSGILNYTRLMIKILGRGSLSEDAVKKFEGYLSLMESELSRCSKIVSNLLTFSRKSKLEFSEVQVNDLMTRCITLSEHKLTLQNIRIEAKIQEGVPPVLGDFNQLQQCMINLIFNAMDAMPDGGVLTIETSYDPGKETVSILVGDTGCGIDRKELPYIFDPFFTTKKEGKGLGLGLSTTYGIIDRHKGTISVESEVGKGTVFVVKLLSVRARGMQKPVPEVKKK